MNITLNHNPSHKTSTILMGRRSEIFYEIHFIAVLDFATCYRLHRQTYAFPIFILNPNHNYIGIMPMPMAFRKIKYIPGVWKCMQQTHTNQLIQLTTVDCLTFARSTCKAFICSIKSLQMDRARLSIQVRLVRTGNCHPNAYKKFH